MSMTFVTVEAAPQSFSPYEYFEDLNESEIRGVQVKVSWIGPQYHSIPAIIITGSGKDTNLETFEPCRRANIYESDGEIWQIETSDAELHEIVSNIGSLDSVAAGGVQLPPQFSFSLVNSMGRQPCFHAVLNSSLAAQLFERVRIALSGNPKGVVVLDRWGCMVPEALSRSRPTEVTSQLNITAKGFRPDPKTRSLVSELTMTNNGPALSGPLSLVFSFNYPNLKAGITLLNRTGVTCGLSPQGAPYLVVEPPGGRLAKGQRLSVSLEFRDPAKVDFEYTTKVYTGYGSR